MADVSDWANTAAGNTGSAPDYLSEGCAPSAVNDAFRELQAAIRRYVEAAQWFDWGHTPTRLTSADFSVTGDLRSLYEVGRRVKMTGSADAYGTVSAVSYTAPDTTVTVRENNVPGTLSTVSVSILSPTDGAFPGVINHGPIDFSGGNLRVTASSSHTAGAGVELAYSASTSFIRSYDRAVSAWKDMELGGLATKLQANGVNGITLAEVAGQVVLALPNAATSVGATAGAGSSLPATPQGYLNITINGAQCRVPYYQA